MSIPGAQDPTFASIPAPSPTGSGAVDEAVAIWRALAHLGVRHVVLSPGSRSAPLVHALQDPEVRRAGVQAHVRIDERSAAFTALGISRADPGHPGVVVTTSGTATAHLHAAVLEAHHSRVPLLVLTADRPAELRGVGANQATHQAGLYGQALRLSADLPAPQADAATSVELRTAVNTVARALAAAVGDPAPGAPYGGAGHPAGPVQVNLGFRDPLVPRAGHVPSVVGGNSRLQITCRVPVPAPQPIPVPLTARTLVVAGDRAGADASAFAEANNLPLLAEPSSGARIGPGLLPHYPSLLAEIMAEPGHPLRPDQAIVFGHPTLSRSIVSGLLGADDVAVVIVDAAPGWADAARRARLVVPAIRADGSVPEPGRYRDALLACTPSRSAADLCWQIRAALAVWEANTEQDTLVLGSSSLIRDLEEHAPAARGPVLAGRGLAGIDGMISTAGGHALATAPDTGAPDTPATPTNAGRTRLLIGDLTALHDLTGLVLGPLETEPDLDVIVVDDGGGRIFSGLEHRQADPVLLERFFTTPHGVDLAAASRALRVPARTIPADAVTILLPEALAERPRGRRLLVVQDDPREDASASIADPPVAVPVAADPSAGAYGTEDRPRRGPGWGGVVGLVAAGMVLSSGITFGGVVAYDQFTGEPSSATAGVQAPQGTTTTPIASSEEGEAWETVAQRVSPSTVAIAVSTSSGQAEGTGVVYDPDGTVVTNNHVVADADDVAVSLHDGRTFTATVVGTDTSTDLAVLKLDDPPDDLVAAEFGDSDQVAVGQGAMAVGTPLGLQNTVTTGIISAVHRPVTTAGTEEDGSDTTYTSALQTDAPINPGNSGGPLVDSSGAVIGINSSIAAFPSGEDQLAGSIGLGFAIPSNTVQLIVPQILQGNGVQHALLGVSASDGDASIGSVTHFGAEVREVTDGSGADAAGLKEGDLITAIDGIPVNGSAALTGLVRSLEVGSTHEIGVIRDGKVQQFDVTFTHQE
jgi:2-succinyl-5-enolpyruvyl-6-hydroxy-3-cyclohexene-1-carboxylate synthase